MHSNITAHIRITSVVLLMRPEYNTLSSSCSACSCSCHSCFFFLAGLCLLVSGVSDLLPGTDSWKPCKETLGGFRESYFQQVWELMQTTQKGAVHSNLFNLKPTLTTRPCQVTTNIFSFVDHTNNHSFQDIWISRKIKYWGHCGSGEKFPHSIHEYKKEAVWHAGSKGSWIWNGFC